MQLTRLVALALALTALPAYAQDLAPAKPPQVQPKPAPPQPQPAPAQPPTWSDPTFVLIEQGDTTWRLCLVMGHASGRDVIVPVGVAQGVRQDLQSVASQARIAPGEFTPALSTFFALTAHLTLDAELAKVLGIEAVPDFAVQGNEWTFVNRQGQQAVSTVLATRLDPAGVFARTISHAQATLDPATLPRIDPGAKLDAHLDTPAIFADHTAPGAEVWARTPREGSAEVPQILVWLTPGNDPGAAPAGNPARLAECKAAADAFAAAIAERVRTSGAPEEQQATSRICISQERLSAHLACDQGKAPSAQQFEPCATP